ncbi:hypothetical protein MKMG_00136 [Methanogenium sp. MK-MG]|nr:hypothetical protein MKMG_00136 [Methanogenium sp. MK-MG]
MASGKEGAVGKLDGKRPVFVCGGEGAFGEDKERSSVPGFFRPDGDAFGIEPVSQVERAAAPGLIFCWCRAGQEGGEAAECGIRDDLRFVRGRDDLGLPVRAFCGVVPLSGGGAVEFPYASGVEVRGVAVDNLV